MREAYNLTISDPVFLWIYLWQTMQHEKYNKFYTPFIDVRMDNMNQHMHFGSYKDFVSNKYLDDLLALDLEIFL